MILVFLTLPALLRAQEAATAESGVATGARQVEEGDFEAAVATLEAAIPRLRGDPARVRLLVQAVGARVTHQYDRPWNASETRKGQLVVIGLKGLDRAAVTRTLLG